MQRLKIIAFMASLLITDLSFAHSSHGRRGRNRAHHHGVRNRHHHNNNRVRAHHRRARRATRRAVRNAVHAVLPVLNFPVVQPRRVAYARPCVHPIARPILAPVVAMNSANHKLFVAASRGQLRKLNKALRRGAFVNAMNPNGQTALHLAAKSGSRACVARLLQMGAGRYIVNGFGRTPAQVALAHGYPGLAQALR